jgi:sulfate transport system permease protein
MAFVQSLRWKEPSALPGFGLAMGLTLTYLGLVVLMPLAALVFKAADLGLSGFWAIATGPRTLSAIKLSVGASLIAAAIDAVFGVLIAWAIVRYRFPGRRLLDSLVDLPFALPTAVAGIALTTPYAPNGWLGAMLFKLGIKVAFAPAGIVVALVFIGLPFVIRTIQPVLEDADRQIEEAAATLGASRFQTIRRVVLPLLAPPIITGFALALARALGEYGSVIFIAGNIPYRTEIAPLLIVIRLEEFNYAGATAIAAVMLALAFAMLLVINLTQAWTRRRYGHG